MTSLVAPGRPSGLLFDPRFRQALGSFHGLWAAIDTQLDFAIGQLLELSYLETHLITAGMMFGPKARLLADLIRRSELPNKSKILGPFNKLRGNNKRNIIAHGYMSTTETTVTFVERIASNEYRGRAHTFTIDEFERHMIEVSEWAAMLFAELGSDQSELQAFAVAAVTEKQGK